MATYHNKKFVSVPVHDADSPIFFTCIQEGLIVRATYTGEEIQCGRFVGMVNQHGELHFTYHHVNTKNELRSGEGRLFPERLSDGSLKLSGSWQGMNGWTMESMLCYSQTARKLKTSV
ncbi:n-acetylglutamate synthase [Fictibacillus enclensis]|uniref:n-acetylglutamate synthase n=1 Tax=Fictibacillus enclensis TaxID=1017270 RepID=UPI0024C0DBC7|nr:n-acetylglutamate synthase [Fictibacillus enclensis]MDM5200791.1 n-acetylglutamate synthase [Fictibacillus enclensis]WHY71666.1 n-acetylglutamate synthase [Fictibacillus enclensis]